MHRNRKKADRLPHRSLKVLSEGISLQQERTPKADKAAQMFEQERAGDQALIFQGGSCTSEHRSFHAARQADVADVLQMKAAVSEASVCPAPCPGATSSESCLHHHLGN